MLKVSIFKIVFLIPAVALALSGCSISFNTGAGGNTSRIDGGVYKSLNKGTTWQQKASILAVGGASRTFASADIIYLTLDPEDNDAIYAGSLAGGLYYSYDGGEGWQLAANSSGETVTNIAVDPLNKCVIYATATNRVLKSSDCSRAWSTIYYDTDLTVPITALVIDFSNNNNIFIGTLRGEIIKSSDRGQTWKTLARFGNPVDKIVISPVNPKVMFIGTESSGVFRSIDAGVKWVNLNENLKDFNDGSGFRDLIMVRAEKPTLFLVNGYGLVTSTDDGNHWSKIDLITPEAGVVINSMAVNPFTTKEIYYVTNTTFYRSLDGGKNWFTERLPTSRAGWKLLINPKNTSIIYLAVRQTKR